MGNGITGGNEAIVHTLRNVSETIENKGTIEQPNTVANGDIVTNEIATPNEHMVPTGENMDNLANNTLVILTIDASNAFNSIDRSKALDYMYTKVPELYLTSLNTYGSASYTIINGSKLPVEQ